MRLIEKYLLGAGFLVLPFVFSSGMGEQMREPKAHFLVLLMGAFLGLSLWREVSKPLGGAAILLYIYAFFSPLFQAENVLVLSSALGSCLLVAKATEDDVKMGLEILEVMGILCAAYAILLQWKNIDPLVHMLPGNDFRRVSVFFGQHTLYGPFCVGAAAPALFRGRHLRAFLMLSPIPLIDASFTYLALGALLACYGVFLYGRRAVLAISCLALLGAAVISTMMALRVDVEAINDNGRLPLWQISWTIAKRNYVLGDGFGSFAQEFPVFQSEQMRKSMGVNDKDLSPRARALLTKAKELRDRSGFFFSAHNEFLQVFYEFGLLGVTFMLACLFSFFAAFYRLPRTIESWSLFSIFVSFLANSLGNFPFHLIPQALLPLWAYVIMTRGGEAGIFEGCTIRQRTMSFFALKISPMMQDSSLVQRLIRAWQG